MLRTAAASLVMAVSGGLVLWQATSGLQAFTAEAARRLTVLSVPRQIRAVPLLDERGNVVSLLAPGREPTLVEFIYTTCPTICLTLGEAFFRIQERIGEDRLSRVRLVSISFDLARDKTAALSEYGRAHGADGRIWTIARPQSEADLRQLLDAFAVTVIPDGMNGFVHNAAIHFVDGQGRLSRIFDIGDDDRVLNALKEDK